MLTEYFKLDYVASAAVILVGGLLALGVRRRCAPLCLPVFGLFVVLADPRFYWLQVCLAAVLQEFGWWESVARNPVWWSTWTVVPRLFVILCAWGIWQAVRSMAGKPRSQATSVATLA